MPLPSHFFEIGPAEVLIAAAARMGIAVDGDALRTRFDGHAAPQSLKALVEIAPSAGIEARAFRSDVAGLSDATLPAIVHVVDHDAEESGFAILVAAGPGGFVLDDGTGRGVEVLDGDAFARVWSGIVVTVARPEGTAVRRARSGGAARRLAAWWRREDPLSRASLLARGAAVALLTTLAAFGAARFGFERAGNSGAALGAAGALAALAAAALGRLLFFAGRHSVVGGALPRLAAAICGRGGADCSGVLASRYSRFAGIDWSSVGLAFYGAALAAAAITSVASPEFRSATFAWLAAAFAAAMVPAVVFIAVQVYPLKRFCPLCMATHAITIATAATLAGAFAGGAGGWPTARELIWAGALHATLFLGGFGLVVPFLALGLESTTNRTRLGWILATPWGALAEAAGRARALRQVPPAPFAIGGPDAPFRLDALVHPMCTGCGPVVTKLSALAARHPDRVRVGLHPTPRDSGNPLDIALCAALAAAGMAGGGEAGTAAFLKAKEKPWPLLDLAKSGPRAVLAALLPEVVPDDALLARARESAVAADAMAARLDRGTPTLLLNGYLWDGTVEDLDKLLTRRADLLAEVLGVAPRRAVAGS